MRCLPLLGSGVWGSSSVSALMPAATFFRVVAFARSDEAIHTVSDMAMTLPMIAARIATGVGTPTTMPRTAPP